MAVDGAAAQRQWQRRSDGGGNRRSGMLEVVTKSEVGQSAVWLLNTLMEDTWDGDDDKIYTNFISRYYELYSVLIA
jgi:hypothetical protein